MHNLPISGVTALGRANTMRFRPSFWAAFVISFSGLLVGSAAPASANTVTFDLDTLLSGKKPHGTVLPWVTVTFTDIGHNAIRLAVTATGLTGREFLGKEGLVFNLDPFPRNLKAKFLHGVRGTFKFAKDHFGTYDRDQLFDASLNFSKAHRLHRHQKSVWKLTGTGLSTADLFGLDPGEQADDVMQVAAFVDTPFVRNQHYCAWITASHEIGGGGSPPPQPVPVPPALWLFGSAVGGLAFTFRRRRTAGLTAQAV
jgi:hypothetical protein